MNACLVVLHDVLYETTSDSRAYLLMDDGARQRVQQALLQMARLAAPDLPPAENAIIIELKRKSEAWPPPIEIEREEFRSDWEKAAE